MMPLKGVYQSRMAPQSPDQFAVARVRRRAAAR